MTDPRAVTELPCSCPCDVCTSPVPWASGDDDPICDPCWRGDCDTATGDDA